MDWYCYSPEYEGPLELVTRDVWGARPPGKTRPLHFPTKYVTITYDTGVDWCRHPVECQERVRQMQDDHMAKGYSDVKYNFLIGGDGYVYEGRGWVSKPPRSKRFPTWHRRIDIGYMGRKHTWEINFDILEQGMNIIHYGVENDLLWPGYRVREWKREGLLMEEFMYNQRGKIYRIWPKKAYALAEQQRMAKPADVRPEPKPPRRRTVETGVFRIGRPKKKKSKYGYSKDKPIKLD